MALESRIPPQPPTTSPRRRRKLLIFVTFQAIILMIGIAVAATMYFGRRSVSPSDVGPSAPLTERDEARAFVEERLKWRFTREVPVAKMDKAEFQALLRGSEQEEVARANRLIRLLSGFGLETEFVEASAAKDRVENEVGGFYDLEVKTVYVPDEPPDRPGGEETPALRQAWRVSLLVHELTHAARDQQFDLAGTARKLRNHAGAALEMRAVAESDAMEMQWEYLSRFIMDEARKKNPAFDPGSFREKIANGFRYGFIDRPDLSIGALMSVYESERLETELWAPGPFLERLMRVGIMAPYARGPAYYQRLRATRNLEELMRNPPLGGMAGEFFTIAVLDPGGCLPGWKLIDCNSLGPWVGGTIFHEIESRSPGAQKSGAESISGDRYLFFENGKRQAIVWLVNHYSHVNEIWNAGPAAPRHVCLAGLDLYTFGLTREEAGEAFVRLLPRTRLSHSSTLSELLSFHQNPDAHPFRWPNLKIEPGWDPRLFLEAFRSVPDDPSIRRHVQEYFTIGLFHLPALGIDRIDDLVLYLGALGETQAGGRWAVILMEPLEVSTDEFNPHRRQLRIGPFVRLLEWDENGKRFESAQDGLRKLLAQIRGVEPKWVSEKVAVQVETRAKVADLLKEDR